MRREFNIDVEVGKPTVNYRETISEKAKFNFTHKK
jgi:elongation factor G